jgi:hypothetical protein
MSSVDKAMATQVKNLQTRTGKSLEELYGLLRQSGLTKHGELRDMLKRDLGMGHGDANTLVHLYFRSGGTGTATAAAAAPAPADVLDGLYAGKKAHLRPIHDKLMAAISKFGEFEVAPKKTYVSLRRKKQFAMIGPATQTRVEVGLNAKGLKPAARLAALPAGGMCQYKVNVTAVEEVDPELIGWIRHAYDSAG